MANTKIPVELSSTPGIVDNSNATAITIDSSENVGIGVSPPSSAQLFDYLFVSGIGVAGLSTEGGLYNNAYYNGTVYKRTNTGYASRIYMASDSSLLYDQASTNSAETDVTFNTALKIDSSGNVGIGTSSPSALLQVGAGGVGAGTNPTTAIFNQKSSWNVNDYEAFKFGISEVRSVYQGSNGWSYTILTGNASSRSERMRIDSLGRLLIGHTSAVGGHTELLGIDTGSASGYGIFISGPSSTNGTQTAFRFYDSGSSPGVVGSITFTTNSTAYNTSSDYRLKENVITDWDATTRLKQLKPSRFNFINEPDITVDGFLAHEVENIVPEAITGQKDAMKEEEYEVTPEVLDEDGNVVTEAVWGTRTVPDYQGIDQSKLVPLLTKALQEQQTIIEDLQARITTLENA